MNFKRLVPALACAATLFSANAQSSGAGLNDPMTRAMMEIYDSELRNNPESYEIYFRRANEYYKFDQYLRALSDIDNAIKYAPASDADFRFSCFSLRADIYQMLGKYREALADYSEALKIDPTSFMALYQKANCEYELGEYAAAKADYGRLRSVNGRSAEALTGLARVAVKENNLGTAQDYMNDAVAMMPADSDIYVRRSSVRRMLGNNTGAVDDLLMAISIDNNSKAFQQLIDMGNVDYPAVITALSNAVSQAPDQGMFYYIRAVIAQAHDHFPQAIADYQKIIDENMYNYAGIYGSLAECYLALCNFTDALDNVNQAIGMTADNGEYLVTLARIYRAQGRPEEALRTVESALSRISANRAALVEKGLDLFALGKFEDASSIFGEMVMDDPDNPMNYLLRAWVVADGLNQPANALPIYTRMQEADSDWSKPSSYHGFSLLFSGKKVEALKWAEEMLRDNRDSDGTLNYLMACLYAQAGELEKGYTCVEDALAKGYSNRYNLTLRSDARVNIAPLREGDRLTRIMANYSYIFE